MEKHTISQYVGTTLLAKEKLQLQYSQMVHDSQ